MLKFPKEQQLQFFPSPLNIITDYPDFYLFSLMAKFNLPMNWNIFVVNESAQKCLVYIATTYD